MTHITTKLGQLLIRIWVISIFKSPTCAALPDPFDVREVTIDKVHFALFNTDTTCREVVSSFISRIEAFNPIVNAIITLNPDALAIADQIDNQIAAGNSSGTLLCIPVLLKDNFDAVGMATTGGCVNLAGNVPTDDAPTVKAFKDAGAIILGKTNLHEMALEGLSVSSFGGQTVNPYDHTRTPGGSSGGTGAAIAANFAIIGTGTDTVNSLRSPASANSLFSFRPTRGLISRAGVIPVSYTQDTVGAMARNPGDLAVALAVMASVGFDPKDNTTELAPQRTKREAFPPLVSGKPLRGLRLGLLDRFFNHTPSAETSPVNELMENMMSSLRRSGVEIANITETIYDITDISALDVQMYEYRELLDDYLSKPNMDGTPRPSTFQELYTSGNFLVIPRHYENIRKAFVSSTSNSSYAKAQHRIQDLSQALQATFARHNLDALIYPEQKNLVVKIGSPSQHGRNGILAAVTGSPVVTVPLGFSPPTCDAPLGVPVGMEILGKPWSEDLLLGIAYSIDELAPVRRMPAFANMTVELKAYSSVPVIWPDRGNIHEEYPLGVF